MARKRTLDLSSLKYLKYRLKRFGKQQEIAVEKVEVHLLGEQRPPALPSKKRSR